MGSTGTATCPRYRRSWAGWTAPQAWTITFTPHLVPMTRGILATCYATLKEGAFESGEAAQARVREVYNDVYDGESFVSVADEPPMTKHTLGTTPAWSIRPWTCGRAG